MILVTLPDCIRLMKTQQKFVMSLKSTKFKQTSNSEKWAKHQKQLLMHEQQCIKKAQTSLSSTLNSREHNQKVLKPEHAQTKIFDLSLADMDIGIYQPLRDLFINQLSHSYTLEKHKAIARQKVRGWYQQYYGVNEQLLINIGFCPSIATAIGLSVLAFTTRGDKVMVMAPAYSFYKGAIINFQRQAIEIQLYRNWHTQRLEMDIKAVEDGVKGCKLCILCHPHNPSGRIWTQQEAMRLSKICREAGAILVSDEILADLAHCPPSEFYSLGREIGNNPNIIVANSVSKAFNSSSIQAGYLIFGSQALHNKFAHYCDSVLGETVDNFALAYIACCLSQTGRQWLTLVKDTIMDNYRALWKFVKEQMPQVRILMLEAAYMVYLQFPCLQSTTVKLPDGFHGYLNENGVYFTKVENPCGKTINSTKQCEEKVQNKEGQSVRVCIACEKQYFAQFLLRFRQLWRNYRKFNVVAARM